MRVVIPCETDQLLEAPRSGHFGHASWLIVADLDEDQKITELKAVKNADHDVAGCGGVIQHVMGLNADAIIAAGMGMPPFTRFTQAGISVFIDRECPTAGEVLARFLEGGVPQMVLDDVCRH